MSQGTLATVDDDGAGYIAQVNAAVARLASKASGTARPSDIATYEDWVDTDTPGTGVRTHNLYDGASDIVLGKLDTTAHTYKHDDGTLTLPKGFISGFTYTNNSGDATNDIDIAAGLAVDATGVRWISGGALTKRLDAAWAVGTAAGGLDTGSIGNSDYYIWAILRSDTGVVDYIFSLSATAPTMPTSYDYKRLIGWFKRVGGTIVAFNIYELAGGGLDFHWEVPTLDVDLASTLTTAGRTDALKVPLNFSTLAHVNVEVYDASSNFKVWIYNPDVTSAAPSGSVAPLANISPPPGTSFHAAQRRIRTSATGTLGARADLATVDEYRVVTIGFEWSRR